MAVSNVTSMINRDNRRSSKKGNNESSRYSLQRLRRVNFDRLDKRAKLAAFVLIYQRFAAKLNANLQTLARSLCSF